MQSPLWVKVSALGLLLSGIVLPEILARTREDYSSLSNYLSELGATGTSTQTLTNTIGFPIVSLTLIILIIYIWRKFGAKGPLAAGLTCLIIGIPAGYLGAVIFPCDYGCPIEGSASQAMHNLLGLVQYPLGVLGFILLGVSLPTRPVFRYASWFAAAAMGVGFVMMLLPDHANFRGAWQRLSDYTAFLVIIYIALRAAPQKAST